MHAVWSLLLALVTAEPVTADLVLRGGMVYDGSLREGAPADVAIRGERIVAVGQFELAGTPRVIDCRGWIVAPGFIDLHSHSDGGITQPRTRGNTNFLMQGCTTVVTGNCGSGPTDVADYFRRIDAQGAGTNVLHLIPHGSLRRQVMRQDANRPPTQAELEEMQRRVEQGMRDGACGMSTGLIYTPGTFAKTEELVALAQVVARFGGLYASHIRNEGAQLLESIEEILTIGQQAGLPVHVSHIKVSGRSNWGLAPDAIARLRQARQAGQRVTADQYPYTASSTSLAATIVPAELRSWDKLEMALQDPAQGPLVRRRLEASLREKDEGRAIVVASYAPQRTWQGKSLAQIAAETGQTPLDIALEILRRGGAGIVNFGMQEDEVRLFMREPYVATASDGSTMTLDAESQPHPRSFGTFPRKIGRYAIEGKIIALSHAIYSASGLPAEILGLTDRGFIRPGYYADLVVFDPETFRDTATYEKPLSWATGTKLVLVNGQIAVENEQPTGRLAGRAIRHPVAASAPSPSPRSQDPSRP